MPRWYLLPDDDADRELVEQTHPPDWANPKPVDRYNLVVVGAGTAGLVTAAGAAGLGAKVALVERGLMGGDCLNFGCVPSKALIRAARTAALLRRAAEYGVRGGEPPVFDFEAAMQRMRRLRARLSPHDSARRFRELGVDVFFGQGRFLDSSTLDVDGTRLSFHSAVIATGARAAVPNIPGLDTVPFLTNETVFNLTRLPRRLGVVGAGPIGCELAQAFAQFGSQVLLVESQHGVLPRDDREGAEVVRDAMQRDGVQLLCCGRSLTVQPNAGGIQLIVESHGRLWQEHVDQLLVATGRTPNLDELNLTAVGVESSPRGVQVNERLQTTNARIFAAGDVCSLYPFTHAADAQARIVIQNSLFRGRKRWTSLVIPWCTYTTPELAHVGLNEQQAAEQQFPLDTYVQPWSKSDRAILDGEEEGFVKVHVRRGTDRLVGATIVAHHAGDLISELTSGLVHRRGLRQIGRTIHPYPTYGDALAKLADQYNRTRLTPMVRFLFRHWLAWHRR